MSTVRLLLLFSIMFYASVCKAKKPWLTCYESFDSIGNSVTFYKKTADLTYFTSFLKKSGSCCLYGGWGFFFGKNFTGQTLLVSEYSRSEQCSNLFPKILSPEGSLRYLGPRDTDTNAISFFQDLNFGGEEFVVKYESEPNLPLQKPLSLILTGKSNWTIFERENFSGARICIVPSGNAKEIKQIDYDVWDIQSIRSVQKGCDWFSKKI